MDFVFYKVMTKNEYTTKLETISDCGPVVGGRCFKCGSDPLSRVQAIRHYEAICGPGQHRLN